MDLLAQMQTFVRVVEAKSLSAAARSQRLSLPAVSRQLRALEQELGVSLIVRSTRRLHVTEAGLRWHEHCLRVLADVEAARADVNPGQLARGTLVVSASLTFGSIKIVPILPALAERFPQLLIDLRLEDRLTDLVSEGVDIAVRAGSPPPDSTAYVAHPLTSMERVLVAAPAWLKKRGTPRTPSDLTAQRVLVQVTPAGLPIPWQLRRKNESSVPEVRALLRCSAPLALRDFAVEGAGIAYLPDFVVATDVAAGRLRRLLPEWSSPPLFAWAIHRAELRGSPKVRAFLDAVATKSQATAGVSERRKRERA